jgi:uncharacterized protein YdhG (YjbR/CyaY superfamily)
MKSNTPDSVDQYISGFPEDIRKLLIQVRTTVQKAAPEAEETIKYGIPTYVLDGNLVHFGGFAKHLAFYPVPRDKTMREKLKPYLSGKSTLKFPLDKPVPMALIREIVRSLVQQRMGATAKGR